MPNQRVLDAVRTYVEKYGKQFDLLPHDPSPARLTLDPDRSRKTAKLYEKLAHRPDHPKVRAAYDQMKTELAAQYDHALAGGLHAEPWLKGGQPYENSAHMAADVEHNHHLFYFPTDAGYGESGVVHDHPLMDRHEASGLRYNDLLRIVHDYYAHAGHGHQFGPKGELNAWMEHARMFGPLARLALSAETHGQNSWVNFGPHSHLPPKDRPFAEQKATVLPVTEHPVQLARPGEGAKGKDTRLVGGLSAALKSIWSEEATGPKHPHVEPDWTEFDGVLHRGMKDGAPDNDGFAKAMAERSAFAQAIQRLGFSNTDPAALRRVVKKFVQAARLLHRHAPDFLPSAHYAKHAAQLNAPDIVQPQPDKTELGEWPEPPKHTHYTVPNIGPAGKDLADAAIPLVRAIDQIQYNLNPNHVRFADAREEPVPKAEPDVPRPPVDTTPYEAVPTIREGHGDKFTIGLADMRKFPAWHRKTSQAEALATGKKADELPPLPLSTYSGETGGTGDRWRDIHQMTNAGHETDKIVKHLSDKYAMKPVNARAAVARYNKAKAAGRVKLARRLVDDATKWTVNQHDQTDRGAFADHLAEEGDPREEIVRHPSHPDAMSAVGYVYRPNPRYQTREPVTSKLHSFGDGTHLRVWWYVHGSPKKPVDPRLWVHWDVRGHQDPYSTIMPESKFDDWMDTFPEDERAKLRETFGERPGEKANKLARLLDRADLVKGVDKDIAGTRLAYHLADIHNHFKDADHDHGQLIAALAKAALQGKGYNTFKKLGRALEEHSGFAPVSIHRDMYKAQHKILNAIDAPGSHLEKLANLSAGQRAKIIEAGDMMPYAHDRFREKLASDHYKSAYNWHKMEDGLMVDRRVHNWLRAKAKEGTSDETLFRRAEQLHGSHDRFTKELNAHAGATHEEVAKSVKRLRDRHDERQELAAAAGRRPHADRPGQTFDSRAPQTPTVATESFWRRAFSWLPGSKHAKFARKFWERYGNA